MGTIVTLQQHDMPLPEAFGKVAVLMGGWSSERAVSLKSGDAVLAALQQRGVDAHGIDAQRETILQELARGQFDRVLPVLGRAGRARGQSG